MKAGKYHMIKSNLFFPLFFTGISLFFSGTLTATSNEDDLSSLLSPEERALVEKELEKQSQKKKPLRKKQISMKNLQILMLASLKKMG